MSVMCGVEKLVVGVHGFQIGQKAVYPSHGVGTIEGIANCAVGGLEQSFYVLKIHTTGVKVMVPTGSAESVGLRSIATGPTLKKVYSILKTPSLKRTVTPSASTWNRRLRRLTEELNTGDLAKIAQVFRNLVELSTGKPLSFGEKRIMERARSMLVAEISAASDLDCQIVETQLDDVLHCIYDGQAQSSDA